jgi:hypothetical protein
MSVSSGAATRLSTKNRIGLVLAGLLGVGDVVSVLMIPSAAASTEPGPPVEVLIAGAVLGVITLVAVVAGWRGGGRVWARITCASRILSMLLSLPAFFVPGVPAEFVAMAAVGVVLTLVAVFLVLARPAAVGA